MEITLIAAMTPERIIGNKGVIPWKGKMPADMAYFKKMTTGKPIIMGRTTFESLGRPLPNRKNIVISRNTELSINGVTVVHSKEDAIRACGDAMEIMVIGGQQLYEMFLLDARRMLLTTIHADCKGDARFPEYNQDVWKPVSTESYGKDDFNEFAYTFQELERIRNTTRH
jgi:dihydrofolate reductase